MRLAFWLTRIESFVVQARLWCCMGDGDHQRAPLGRSAGSGREGKKIVCGRYPRVTDEPESFEDLGKTRRDHTPFRAARIHDREPSGTDRQRSGGHALGRWRSGLHCARVQRRATGWWPVRREHACDERSGMRGAGGYEPGPSLAPELLADPLVDRPCAAARSGR